MITPEYLSYMLDTLTVQNQLETTIVQDIARRIVKSGVVTATADYQTERAQAAGILYNDLVRKVSEAADMTESEIAYAFEDAGTEVFNYPEATLEENSINPAKFKRMSPAMKKLWDAALSKTTTEAVNLTKTTAVTSQSLFISACDLAHMQVASGAFDYKMAIANAVKTAASQGARVVYPTGHTTSLYAAVRRAVLTGVNQTAGRLQEMRAGEYNVDLMEISAHMGARPSHAAWQGRIVSLSGRRGYLTTDDIQYGDVRGFMGANCRHTWYMFFEGDTPANSEEYLQELRNGSVTYEGKAMPEYEASQIQRSMERNIRKSKTGLAGLDAAAKAAEEIKDNELAASLKQQFAAESVRLKKREAKLKDFCSQTGRDADSSRMQMPGFDRSVSGKAVWSNRKELQKRAEDDIIKEIKACGIRGKIQLTPKPIDVTDFTFDNEHINIKDHDRGISRKTAESYMHNAKFSVNRWNGQFIDYFSEDGATYIDIQNRNIRTSFSKEQFTENIKNAMEVLKKYGK